MSKDPALRQDLVALFQDYAIGSHLGVSVITKKLASIFYWKGVWRDVKNYIRNCSNGQIFKFENIAAYDLLQPLPIPSRVFIDIFLNFIKSLLRSH